MYCSLVLFSRSLGPHAYYTVINAGGKGGVILREGITRTKSLAWTALSHILCLLTEADYQSPKSMGSNGKCTVPPGAEVRVDKVTDLDCPPGYPIPTLRAHICAPPEHVGWS
jgi:hypothetical protein